MSNTVFPSFQCSKHRIYTGVDYPIHSPDSDVSMQMGSNVSNFSLQPEVNSNASQIDYAGLAVPPQFSYSTAGVNCRSKKPGSDSGITRQKLLLQATKSVTREKRKRPLEAPDLLLESSIADIFRNMAFPKHLNMNKKKSTEQPTVYAQKFMTPVRQSQKISDKITALHQLVSPYGKTDMASVLQEAWIYIKTAHREIQRLSISYFGGRSLQSQGNGEKQPELQSEGLCLVPVSTTMKLAEEHLVDYQNASMTTSTTEFY